MAGGPCPALAGAKTMAPLSAIKPMKSWPSLKEYLAARPGNNRN